MEENVVEIKRHLQIKSIEELLTVTLQKLKPKISKLESKGKSHEFLETYIQQIINESIRASSKLVTIQQVAESDQIDIQLDQIQQSLVQRINQLDESEKLTQLAQLQFQTQTLLHKIQQGQSLLVQKEQTLAKEIQQSSQESQSTVNQHDQLYQSNINLLNNCKTFQKQLENNSQRKELKENFDQEMRQIQKLKIESQKVVKLAEREEKENYTNPISLAMTYL